MKSPDPPCTCIIMYGPKTHRTVTQSLVEIHISLLDRGRKTILTPEEEQLISEPVLYYASNLTSLSRTAVNEMDETVLQIQKTADIDDLQFIRGWLYGFLRRHANRKVVALQCVESSRTTASIPGYICDHIPNIKF